jgi:hypothetical protein
VNNPEPRLSTVSADALHHERMWSIFAPSLVSDPGFDIFQLPASAHGALDASPRKSQQLHRRLGRRFEAHWTWAFTQLEDWQLLAAGLSVRDGRRTAGELDLLASNNGCVWHLELAVKFYLCVRGQSGDQPDHWVGPGGHDRLDKKLAHMRTHQLPMGQSPLARETLSAQGLPVPDRSAAILRGVRFAHWQSPHPDATGLWCSADELPAAMSTARLLRRTEWLGHGPSSDEDWLSGDALRSAIATEHIRGAAQLLDPDGTRWLVLRTPT